LETRETKSINIKHNRLIFKMALSGLVLAGGTSGLAGNSHAGDAEAMKELFASFGLALFLTRTAISMPSMIGLIMLMGIATKNSILLVEYAIVSRRAEALLDACRKRVRPIVMTTMAMGAGMLPVALDLGTGDGSFRSPMAIVVIGGLITSTFLSLLVIPVVFTYVDDVIVWFSARVRKYRHVHA
jgi:predicted RND superfamily exporter protein